MLLPGIHATAGPQSIADDVQCVLQGTLRPETARHVEGVLLDELRGLHQTAIWVFPTG